MQRKSSGNKWYGLFLSYNEKEVKARQEAVTRADFYKIFFQWEHVLVYFNRKPEHNISSTSDTFLLHVWYKYILKANALPCGTDVSRYVCSAARRNRGRNKCSLQKGDRRAEQSKQANCKASYVRAGVRRHTGWACQADQLVVAWLRIGTAVLWCWICSVSLSPFYLLSLINIFAHLCCSVAANWELFGFVWDFTHGSSSTSESKEATKPWCAHRSRGVRRARTRAPGPRHVPGRPGPSRK